MRPGAREAALGTGKTRLETLEGLAVHHGYHPGQLSLLKRLTAGWPLPAAWEQSCTGSERSAGKESDDCRSVCDRQRGFGGGVR